MFSASDRPGHSLNDKCVLYARVDIDTDTTDVIIYATKSGDKSSDPLTSQERISVSVA